MTKIYSLGEVAKFLGIQHYKIAYMIATKQIPEPEFRFLNKRCFTENEVQQVAAFFGVPCNLEEQR